MFDQRGVEPMAPLSLFVAPAALGAVGKGEFVHGVRRQARAASELFFLNVLRTSCITRKR